MKGKVYLIGAGPGATDLITIRGLEILHQADVVIYDYLVNKELLQEAKPEAELICADELDGNKHNDGFIFRQEEINKFLVKKAQEGKKVVRLKNGDPAIFGRLSQELEALANNKIEFEIVPGVTAGTAAACFSGVPLTDRRFASSVVFVTGHEAANKKESSIDWKNIAKAGTIVLYMGVENVSKIAEKLIVAGKYEKTPVAVVSRVGQIDQQTVSANLKNVGKVVKDQNIISPTIFIVGEVARLEKEFNWLRKNKRVLFTGLSKKRYFIEGTYFHLPLIEIKPLTDYSEFDNYLKDIEYFDWIVFTSRYGVEYFFRRLDRLGKDARILKDIKIAVIGNSTRNRLLDFGLCADLVPLEESSKGLIDVFKQINIKNKKIFLPKSNLSDKGLTVRLEKLGAKVTSSVAYENVMPEKLPDINLYSFDEIMFTSPSGVRNFIKRYGNPPKKIKISCIGDVTLKEVKKWDLLD